ncbi:sporulation membrane protein YtaF [Tepidibacillus fermentans]|uniref:Putative sporulation protein YtaF n=1 Tax=Tepidibacillus fermentans TaxID=1281767 RepID=A0A4R3KJS1_9BACI|nr:sporulation membrane protein YtaF [Tepidibacillus fermentans]TCS83562.1 putative sporulation protein YtaF [Tepidibacillus fermentans]
MNIVSLLILSLAVSLDSFSVGVTYGLRKVIIPIYSIMIISIASATMILLSMQLGIWIQYFLSPHVAKFTGATILIFIGLWAIIQVFRQKNEDDDHEISYDIQKILTIELKKLGLMIQILKTPMKADIDRSGSISSIEAIFLGLALSLDAFGAGLGASLIGFKPLITAITIAGMSGLFILIGIKIGFWFSEIRWLKKFTLIPGIILILMGFYRFF